MIFSYNAFVDPTIVTNGDGTKTCTFIGGSGVIVRFNANGPTLTYNSTAGTLYAPGGVTSVELVRTSDSAVLERIPVSNSAKLVGNLNTFVNHAVTVANLIDGWFDGNFHHIYGGSAAIVYATDGTSMTIPVADATNTLVGYLKVKGTGLTSTGYANGKITQMIHENTSHVQVGTDVVNYTSGTPASYLAFGMLKVTNFEVDEIHLIDGWFGGSFDHAGTITYGGTTMVVPIYNASNVLQGYIEMTGTGLTASGLGTITTFAHTDTSHAAVGLDQVTYTTPVLASNFVDVLAKVPASYNGDPAVINAIIQASVDRHEATTNTTSLSGGTGADTYVLGGFSVASISDAGGIDTVTTTINRDISTFGTIENVTLLGTSSIGATGNGLANIVTGNSGANAIYGNAGNDTLNGLDGGDTLDGGLGDDILNGGNGADNVTGGGGLDKIAGDAGDDTLHGGDANDTVTGGVGNDQIWGDNGNDTLNGNDGVDTIEGGAGTDKIFGDAGNDLLTGGAGNDTLTGGLGADKFIFTATSETPTTGPDIITDFTHNATLALSDRIDLSGIDANTSLASDQSFTFIGTAAFNGSKGVLRYATSLGKTLVQGDVNGDKVADFTIQLTGTKALVAADFIL